MKKIFLYITTALAIISFNSCSDKDSITEEADREFMTMFRTDDTVVLVDPAMADNGRLYTSFSDDFPLLMRSLCSKADIVIKSGKKEQTLKVSQSLYAGALPDEPWFSKSYIERTDREKAGFRGPVKSWCEVTYTTYHKYFYDEAGHLVKEEYHDTSNNSVEVRWVHTYDAQGRRIKSEDI